MANTTTITGNLTREPEIRYTREGQGKLVTPVNLTQVCRIVRLARSFNVGSTGDSTWKLRNAAESPCLSRATR